MNDSVEAATLRRTFHTRVRGVAGASSLLAGVSAAAISIALASSVSQAAAQTWQGTTSDWNTASNWNPATVPSFGNSATFGATGLTSVTLSALTQPNAITFSANAPAYTISSTSTAYLALYGAGITNSSTQVQTLSSSAGGSIQFLNSSSAGNALLTASNGGYVQFFDTSSATNAKIQLGSAGTLGVETAGNLNVGELSGASGSEVGFSAYSSPTPSLTVGGLGTSTTFAGSIYEDTQSGPVTGSLVKTGAGTLTLSGSSSYSGGTTVNAGVLAVGADTALGTGGVTLSPGTTLSLQGVAISNVVSGSGDPDIMVNGANSMPTYTGAAGTTYNILGQNNSLSDQLTVKTANATFAGVTNVGGTAPGNSVTLIGGATNAFGASATMNVFTGSVLDLGGNAQTVTSLQGGGTVTNNGGTNAVLTDQGPSSTFSGVIKDGTTNTTGLTLNASGNTLTLTGTNTYTGPTTVTAGTLKAGGLGAFSGISATTVGAGGTLDINGFNQTVSALSGGGTVTNSTATQAFLTNQGASSQFDGVITDSGNSLALVQNSAGNTLTLTGANTYHGPTQIQAGTLALKTGGSIVNSADVQIATGATFDISQTTSGATINTLSDFAGGKGAVVLGSKTLTLANAATTFSGDISGAGGVTFAGGTQVLAGANAYTGATNIQTGATLQFATGGSIAAASLTTVVGTLDVNGTTQTLTSVQLQSGSIIDTAGGGGLTAGVTSTNGTISAKLTGAGSLTTLSGITTLSNAGNNYTGPTTVAGGTLKALAAGALSASSVTSVFGTLDLGGFAQTVNTVNLSGGTIQNGKLTGAVSSTGGAITANLVGASSLTTSAGVTNLSGTDTYTGATNVLGGTLKALSAGALSANSATTVSGTLDLGGFATTTLLSVNLNGGTVENGSLIAPVTSTGGAILISLVGTSSLTTTAGVTTLSGTDTYTGATTITAGTLKALNAGALSANSATAVGGTLDLGGFATTLLSVNLNGGTILNGSLTAPVTSTGGAIMASLVSTSSLTTTAGLTTLSGTNTYSGATNVMGGTLLASVSNTLSAGSVTTVGGTLDLNGTTQNVTSIVLDGGTIKSGVLKAGDAITETAGSAGAVLNDAISGVSGTSVPSSASLTTSAFTSTVLSGTNTFSGITNVANANILNTGTTSDDLNNAGNYTNTGTQNANIASNTGTITNNSAATWNGNVNAGANTAGGLITNLGTWNGTGNNDGGTLNNSATWTGAINNNSGTFNNNAGGTISLLVTNAGTGTNAGTIAALANTGGTFNNTNIITGAANVSGGTLTTTGLIGGGLTNSATVNAAGTIDGTINNNAGVFTVTGGLTNDGNTFTNAAGATLDVNSGAFSGLATLANAGTVTVESSLSATTINQNGPTFTIATGGSVNATTFTQTTGTTTNNGQFTAANPIAVNGGTFANNKTITGSVNNAATFNNNGGATVSGSVGNSATATNAGQIGGPVTNTAGTFNNTGTIVGLTTVTGGTFTTTGEIDGGLTNSATVNAAGIIKGAINNNTGGLITVTGALLSDNSSTVTNAVGATLDVNGGPFGNIATLTNAGTVTVENTLTATTINQNGPTFTVATTGAVNVGAFTQTTGTTTNNGQFTATNPIAVNGGTFANNKTITGSVNNAATFNNNGGATVSGSVSNSAMATNAGQIGGPVTNTAGTFNNTGVIVGLTTVTGGALTTTGEIDGGLTNSATVNAAGIIKGAINNNTGGLITVTGALVSDNNSTVTNAFGATLDVNGGPFSNIATLTNTGTVTVENTLTATTINQNGPTFTVATTGAVNVGAFTQTTGTTTNNGQFTAANPVVVNGGTFANNKTITGSVNNAATFNNNSGATVSGSVSNSATATNAGQIGGPVTNTAGTFNNSGVIVGLTTVTGGTLTTTNEIDGGLTNSGTVNASGIIKGAINNNAGGLITVTGALMSDNSSKVSNAAGATLDVNGGPFTNIATLTNTGTVTVENTLAATTINQSGPTFTVAATGVVNAGTFIQTQGVTTNGGSLTATGGVVINGGDLENNATINGGVTNAALYNNNAGATQNGNLSNTAGTTNNAGTIDGAASVTGGTLNTTGTITGMLTNKAIVNASGNLGAVDNFSLFTITGNLSSANQSFVNEANATVSFSTAGLSFTNVATFTNSGTVTIGQYPGNGQDTIAAQNFQNNGLIQGTGSLNGSLTNNGSIYVGAANAVDANGYGITIGGNLTNNSAIYLGSLKQGQVPTNSLTVNGALNGGGVINTTADLTTARANTITVTGAVSGGQLNIALATNAAGQTNPNNNYFGTLPVAHVGSGGFTDTPATESALANASTGFYKYSFGSTGANSQGIVQIPNAAAVSAPLAQVASTITALNTSFFQNSSAFLGQATNPEPNHVSFGVWTRDAVSDTNVASTSTLSGTPSSALPSHVDTRLAGMQYGLDAGLFNIQNSGFNTHFGLTVGDVFASSVDHTNIGVSSRAEVPFVGAYGALTGHGFAGIVGIRYDRYNLTLTNPFEGVVDQPLGGHGLTYSGDVQYVIPIGTVAFVEPSGGVYVSRTAVQDQTFAAGVNNFGNIDSVLSRIGLRAGVATKAGIFVLQPFTAINVYHEWAGDAQTLFTPAIANPPTLAIDTTRIGTFEQASIGVGWQVPGGGWTGYARADAKFGREVEGWTLTAGLRYNW